MADNSLLVMVPTRGRRAQCERLLDSFRDTASPGTDITFILDPDDADTYEGVEWGDALVAVLDPRASLTGKLNKTAEAVIDAYDTLMWVGDDHVFRPPKDEDAPAWDQAMLAALADMGGSGWVYPKDGRRDDVPEIWMVSSDIVKTLGWFANPQLGHYYIDNSAAEIGRRSGLLRYCPEAFVEHLHYQCSADTQRDQTYSETEARWGTSDLEAFRQWQGDQAKLETAILRRHFSPDVAWVLSKVA